MRKKTINVRTDEKTKKLLQKAADRKNISLATFVRMSAVERAKEILKKEGENAERH